MCHDDIVIDLTLHRYICNYRLDRGVKKRDESKDIMTRNHKALHRQP